VKSLALLAVASLGAALAAPALAATPTTTTQTVPQAPVEEAEGSAGSALFVAVVTAGTLVLLTYAGVAVRRERTASEPVVEEQRREPRAVLSEHARRVAEYTRTPLATVQPVAQPLPKAAATGWETCTIEWWRGYVKSDFYAVAAQPDGRRLIAGRSSLFRWRDEEPPPRSDATEASLRSLVERLEDDGWERVGRGERWYELSFQRPR
jgi:hypothetical protein